MRKYFLAFCVFFMCLAVTSTANAQFNGGLFDTRQSPPQQTQPNVFGGQNYHHNQGSSFHTTPNVFGGKNLSNGGYTAPNVFGGWNFFR